MSTPEQTPNTQRGFTLIELMIALTLFSFAVAGVLSVAVTMTQAFREQRMAVAAEGAVRAPLDYLADALRQSSPGAAEPSKVADLHSCLSGAINVTNNSNAPDVLDIMYASGGVVTSSVEAFAGGATLKVQDATKLAVGDYVMINDYVYGLLAKITSITGTAGNYSLGLATACSISGLLPATTGSFPPGSIVVRAQHAQFYVSTVEGVTTLMMDPDGPAAAAGGTALGEPFSEGIEDMQIALAVDTNGTPGIQEVGAAANDDEWIYNYPGDSPPATGALIRAVRITLIAQTSRPLFGNQTTFFNRPEAEDRAAGSSDNYRRRVLTTTVELRNVTGSP